MKATILIMNNNKNKNFYNFYNSNIIHMNEFNEALKCLYNGGKVEIKYSTELSVELSGQYGQKVYYKVVKNHQINEETLLKYLEANKENFWLSQIKGYKARMAKAKGDYALNKAYNKYKEAIAAYIRYSNEKIKNYVEWNNSTFFQTMWNKARRDLAMFLYKNGIRIPKEVYDLIKEQIKLEKEIKSYQAPMLTEEQIKELCENAEKYGVDISRIYLYEIRGCSYKEADADFGIEEGARYYSYLSEVPVTGYSQDKGCNAYKYCRHVGYNAKALRDAWEVYQWYKSQEEEHPELLDILHEGEPPREEDEEAYWYDDQYAGFCLKRAYHKDDYDD